MVTVERKPKVAFIIPPSIFLADERVFPSLGILKVAAVLEQKGYPVSVLDLNGVENYLDCFQSFLTQEQETQFFGITATSPQMSTVSRIAQHIAENSTGKIILGGPHVTAAFASLKTHQKGKGNKRGQQAVEQLLQMSNVVVAGDGEFAMEEAMYTTEHFVDADNPDTALFMSESALDQLPFPARHLIDFPSYRYSIDGYVASSLVGQLGCPYNCSFCGLRLSPAFRRVRVRSAERIVEEMSTIYHTYGIRGLMFYDDEINIPTNFPELMRRICDLQEQLGVDFRLRAFVKANLFTEEQAKLMYQAGFRIILTGFESGSERILTNIEKKSTKTQNTRCVDIAHTYGLKVKALMSLGHAGETAETIQETRDWLLQVQPDDFDCTVITVYPGTPYYDFSSPAQQGTWVFTAKNGDRLYSYDVDFLQEDSYYKGIPGEYQSFVFTDALRPEEIVQLRDQVEQEVRKKLGIPFCVATSPLRFEASMGQLPGHIYKSALAKI